MNSLINPQPLSKVQIEHLQEILGGFGKDYKALRKKKIYYSTCRDYILQFEHIIKQSPTNMFMFKIMLECLDYRTGSDEIKKYMKDHNISSVPYKLISKIDANLINKNIPISHPARYTEYRKMIAYSHAFLLNKAINNISTSSESTPISNVPHTTNVATIKKEQTMTEHSNDQRPANSATITEIREKLSKINPNFKKVKAFPLSEMIKTHGVTLINNTPIRGTNSGKCGFFYNLTEVNEFINSDFVKSYKSRKSTKRELNRVNINSTDSLVPLKYINEKLAKINKAMTRESLEKKGVYAVTQMIDINGMCWLYSMKQADTLIKELIDNNNNSKINDSVKVTELVTTLNETLNKFTEETKNLIKFLSK